jgi:hypothetical protein
VTILAIAAGGAALWKATRQRPELELPGRATGPAEAPPRAEGSPAAAEPSPAPEPRDAPADPTPTPARERDFGGPTRFGRVLGPGGAPLAGAVIGAPRALPLPEGSGRALLLDAPAELARSGEDGGFAIGSSVDAALLAVAAPSCGTVIVARSWLSEQEGAPLEIRLERAGTLQALVVDERGNGRRGVEVRVCTLAWLTSRLRLPLDDDFVEVAAVALSTTNGRGEATVAGLPAGIPFQVQLWREGAPRLVDREELELEPGESRDRRWTLMPGATVNGRVVDESGAPVPDLEMKLASVPELGAPGGTPVPASGGAMRPTIRADKEGNFTIRDLAPGRYVLASDVTASTIERDGALPSMTPFDVPPVGDSIDVELVVRRGHSIRGKVVAPDGKPARAEVRVKSEELGALPFMSRKSDDEGRFVLGPFEGGTWELFAASLDPRFAASGSRFVELDAEDVELRLRPGAEVRPTAVRSRDGERVEAMFAVVDSEGRPAGIAEGATIRALAPGRYLLVATTTDGSIGFEREIDVSEGEQVEGVRVRVDPGAILVVTNGDALEHPIELFAGDVGFASGRLAPGATREFVVPTSLKIRGLRGSSPIEQKLELKQGERRALAWPPVSGEDRRP